MGERNKRTLPWDDFEGEVAATIQREIDSYRTMLIPERVRVIRKPKYFSKDRGDYITFDVGVEGFQVKHTEPAFRWIIECKDYPKNKVDVSEVEEFVGKLHQIGPENVSGSMCTRVGFKSGALKYARSRHVALYTLEKEVFTIIQLSAEAPPLDVIKLPIVEGLLPTGDELSSELVFTFDDVVQIELRRAGFLS